MQMEIVTMTACVAILLLLVAVMTLVRDGADSYWRFLTPLSILLATGIALSILLAPILTPLSILLATQEGARARR